MTALDDIVKNLQGVGGTIVSTGGNIASGISGGISSLSTSLPTINLPTVNLPNINLPNVSLPTLPTNIQLPQMQLPTINLPKLPTKNLPKLPTNIQMPQIQLPAIDASRINIPQTLQTAIQLPISSMAVPGSLAIGAATTLAAPAIREVITGTKLFPAGAACTTCPSTEELLIANKIDPSKYTLTPLPTVTHQPTQAVLPQPTRQQLIRASETQPSIITIPGPSTEGVGVYQPTTQTQQKERGIFDILDAGRDLALSSPYMKIFERTSPMGAAASGLLSFGNAAIPEGRNVEATWVEKEKLNKMTNAFNVKASKYTASSPEIQEYSKYLNQLESEGMLQNGVVKYDQTNAAQIAKISKLGELEQKADSSFNTIVSQHSDLQRDLDAINIQKTNVMEGEYWDTQELKGMTTYPVVGGLEIIGKKVQEFADWEEKGLKNVTSTPTWQALRANPVTALPTAGVEALATGGRWATTGIANIEQMGMAVPAVEFAWRYPTRFADALIPGAVAMGAGMVASARENPAKFAVEMGAPLVLMSGLGIAGTKLQGIRTGRPVAWEDIGYFGGIKEEALWKYQVPTTTTKSTGVMGNFLSGAKSKSNSFLEGTSNRLSSVTGRRVSVQELSSEGEVGRVFSSRELQPSSSSIRSGQSTVRDFLSSVSERTEKLIGGGESLGEVKVGGRTRYEITGTGDSLRMQPKVTQKSIVGAHKTLSESAGKSLTERELLSIARTDDATLSSYRVS